MSVGLLAAIFVSNVPEAIGGANDMRRQMHGRGQVTLNWVGIASACALATGVGYAVADTASDELQGGLMLVDSMIPRSGSRWPPDCPSLDQPPRRRDTR